MEGAHWEPCTKLLQEKLPSKAHFGRSTARSWNARKRASGVGRAAECWFSTALLVQQQRGGAADTQPAAGQLRDSPARLVLGGLCAAAAGALWGRRVRNWLLRYHLHARCCLIVSLSPACPWNYPKREHLRKIKWYCEKLLPTPELLGFCCSLFYPNMMYSAGVSNKKNPHLDFISKSATIFCPCPTNCSKVQVFLATSIAASWTSGISTGDMVSLL